MRASAEQLRFVERVKNYGDCENMNLKLKK